MRRREPFPQSPRSDQILAGAGREQAERSSGNAAKHIVLMPELRRQGSLLPAYEKISSLSGAHQYELVAKPITMSFTNIGNLQRIFRS